MELGDYPENRVLFRLDEKIEAAVSDAEREYRERGLRLKMMLSPVTILADPVQFDRVIANIMENSQKYKEAENGLLRIALTREGSAAFV